jgi:hypothetical protein
MEGGGRRRGAESDGRDLDVSRGARPILHDGNSAPLSEDYDPSEIATDRIWKRDYNWPCARHDMFRGSRFRHRN